MHTRLFIMKNKMSSLITADALKAATDRETRQISPADVHKTDNSIKICEIPAGVLNTNNSHLETQS